MKKLIFSILAYFLFIQMGYAQEKNVVKYQYWIDATGSDNALTNIVNGKDISFSIDTKTLSLGMHQLYFRFQDSNGAWSSLQSWLFFVNGMKKNKEVKIIQGEYWIDNNEKQEIAIDNDQIAFALDASKVNEGMHTLNYSLANLVKTRVISREAALKHSENPADLAKNI